MKIITSLILAMFIATSAMADCEKPTAPILPNPDTAVTAQMIKAKNEIKTFLTAAEEYLKCAEDTAKHNAMVDSMQQAADEFNNIVRKYKQRMTAK